MKVSEQNLLNVCDTLGTRTVAGAAAGRGAGPKLKAAAAKVEPPWILDFSGVELITASAFREAILPVVNSAARDRYACVLVNVNEVTRDEGLLAAAQAGVVLLFGTLEDRTIGSVQARGQLDAKLVTALKLLIRLGEADAKAISTASGEDTVTTAWNNRLVALTRMGLVAERKVGKTKFYSPAMKGMSYGK